MSTLGTWAHWRTISRLLQPLGRAGGTIRSGVSTRLDHGGSCLQLPSPWIGCFDSEADFTAAAVAVPALMEVLGNIDDQLVASRHPRLFPAFCSNCESVQTMRIDWRLVGSTPDGSIHPAWTETSVCQNCGLNSRMRAMLGFVLGHDSYSAGSRCYLAERVTVSHTAFSRHFRHLTASEYLGKSRTPGEQVFVARCATRVRHEDLTRLSFSEDSFDWIVTQDVFEHVPDYATAFRECARVLAPGGHLAFSVPFNSDLSRTKVRARSRNDGTIEHILPPEIHGDPVDGNGALCFQNFGWDILDTLRGAGFVNASAHAYWGPWLGHIGLGGFVFSATK